MWYRWRSVLLFCVLLSGGLVAGQTVPRETMPAPQPKAAPPVTWSGALIYAALTEAHTAARQELDGKLVVKVSRRLLLTIKEPGGTERTCELPGTVPVRLTAAHAGLKDEPVLAEVLFKLRLVGRTATLTAVKKTRSLPAGMPPVDYYELQTLTVSALGK